jgi:Tfp pilus assembly protein PilF
MIEKPRDAGMAQTSARASWWRQFGLLYGPALVLTLIPFGLSGESAQRFIKYGITGRFDAELRSAQRALLTGRLDEAVFGAELALAMDSRSMVARAVKANAQFERYWVSRAETDRASAKALADSLAGSNESTAYTARGNLEFLEGDTAAALGLLRHAVEAGTQDAYAHHQLGFVLNAAGSSRQAIQHFRTAIELEPDMAWVKENLLDAMVRVGQCDTTLANLAPSAVAGCSNTMGIQQYQARHFDQARASFENAVRFAPDSGVFHANLASAFVGLNQSAAAMQHGRRAVELGVTEHWVIQALGLK